MRLRHSKSHGIFAQCWCQSGISDAMWRIYSPGGLGVRISTTKEKLEGVVKPWAESKGYRWDGRAVEYEEPRTLDERLTAIRDDLAADFKIERAADALFLKRESFEHEDEWRAVITCGDRRAKRDQSKGIAVPVIPEALIDNILLDPRAPQELTDALGHYFTSKLGYTGVVKRSALYKVPKPIIVDDEDL